MKMNDTKDNMENGKMYDNSNGIKTIMIWDNLGNEHVVLSHYLTNG